MVGADTARLFPRSTHDMPQGPPKKKRKRTPIEENAAIAARRREPPRPPHFATIEQFSDMLYVDIISKDEMVVVEQPWEEISAHFPPALHRKIYGT